jgi:predicted metal-dependent phosphoesterase TrpH
MTRADLHAHTTASDGQQTPTALVQLAQQIGLQAVAITDHDTTGGVEEAQTAAPPGLRVIPGVELSAEDVHGDVHMLGYFIDIHQPVFQQSLEDFRVRRFYRAQAIVDKLAGMGMPLDWSQIEAQVAGGAVGRGHIARAMVAAGYVAAVPDAFERYLYPGGPAYVARKRLSPEESIELIHLAGGAAVLAHPVLVADYAGLLPRLVAAGLDGVETAYPLHSAQAEAELREIARRHDLVMTGGSDFHGIDVPGKAMLGATLAPPGAIDGLRQRAVYHV